MRAVPALRAAAAGAAFCLALAACASPAAAPAPAADSHLTLSIQAGPAYSFTQWYFIFPVTIYPQMACWLERPDGAFVRTVWSTAKAARGGWSGAPAAGRPEALPIWRHAAAAATDASAAATPTAGGDLALAADGLAPGDYLAKLEVNRSYDFNAAYPRKGDGVNGQPSLLYQCRITVGRGPAAARFEPVGTGSPDGSDGLVRPGLAGLTGALDIVTRADIAWRD